MARNERKQVLIAGGGIGGLAAAVTCARQGQTVQLLERAAQFNEVGAGIQIGPNVMRILQAWGLGDALARVASFPQRLLARDAQTGRELGSLRLGDRAQALYGAPYATIHRADLHRLLHQAAQGAGVDLRLGQTVQGWHHNSDGPDGLDVRSADGHLQANALIGADGVKSVVREQFVGDPARVTGHVVYRAVVDKKDFPQDLQWNAAAIWVGPNCHLVHYPLRGGEQYNVVVTFHSRQQEEWGVTDGSKEEVQSYFQGICPKARQLIDLPKTWKRWATADREPIGQWTYGRVTLLGDAAHPTTQYMAQGACMAMEDAVTLGEALRTHGNDWPKALDMYQRARVARTARIVLSSREMGRIYHAKGVERLVRNDLWRGRGAERFYDAMEWLYGWNVGNCLDAAKHN